MAPAAAHPAIWNRRIEMTRIAVSRRKGPEAGAAGPAGVEKDEAQFEALMADNFMFSSAAGDDHISRSTFKTQCWDTQAKLIERSDLERVITSGDEAFVKYLCRTTN